MANSRDIKRRIKSVTSTQQITRAMKMVSAAKLRRSQEAALSVRSFAQHVEQMICHMKDSLVHPYLQHPRPVEKVCYVVLGFDQGLCGGFSANLNRFVSQTLAEETREWELLVVGSQQRNYCRRLGLCCSEDEMSLSDDPTPQETRALATLLRSRYDSGRYDEVHLIYSHFVSVMTQEPMTVRLLPIEEPRHCSLESIYKNRELIFEPSPEAVLDTMLPYYVNVAVYSSVQEAKASEHGARMTAMNAATDNAAEMINELTLSLNRARQGAITTEISEIVGGANALASSN